MSPGVQPIMEGHTIHYLYKTGWTTDQTASRTSWAAELSSCGSEIGPISFGKQWQEGGSYLLVTQWNPCRSEIGPSSVCQQRLRGSFDTNCPLQLSAV